MIKRSVHCLLFLFVCQPSYAQKVVNTTADRWADSVLKTLSNEERITQLMVVRLSSIDPKTRTVTFFDSSVADLVSRYNIGGVCLFQGSPVKQARVLNSLQTMAKTPILMCIDAEWGLGMRMTDSVLPLPKQMMLGAVQDAGIAYQYGNVVGEQCKRMGIQVNYAPVVDINNNPNNPVINDRSFGEDKYKVAAYAIQYMKGMQDVGVMACAKHFPGHGDVSVDSHYDLPLINRSMAQLDSVELYPFREIFKAGIGSVMMAHLAIPAIDDAPNRPTSISKKNVTDLMKNKMGYTGLTFTDALEMQGVKKFYPDGAASVQSLIAGNDMLCLPGDVPLVIAKIKEAIDDKELSWEDITAHCKKVLVAKYQYGLSNLQPIDTDNLTNDLNSKVPGMRRLIAENALTLLRKTDPVFFPLKAQAKPVSDIVYVSVGNSIDNSFAKRMRTDYNADVIYFSYDDPDALSVVRAIKKKYKKVIIGVHGYNRAPANNFGISRQAVALVTQLQQQTTAITFVFGNVYAIKNWCNAKNLIACYEDDEIVQNTAIDLLQGKIGTKGKIPVTICPNYKYGSGIAMSAFFLPRSIHIDGKLKLDPNKLTVIDSIANDAIAKHATPGCVILVVKDGIIAYHKAYGSFEYNKKEPVELGSVYDIASVTKICATNIAIMKLFDEGKIELNKHLGDYLPWVKGSNKAHLAIQDILLHQAGLIAYIPFYKKTLMGDGSPDPKYYSAVATDTFGIRVANGLYMRNDWEDTLYKLILASKLADADKYIYSDNDFIFLGKVVEAISGKSLDEYVRNNFYTPMGLTTIDFKPLEKLPLQRIAPTEKETNFRQQLLRGDVHDPGAAMLGGVAGHAGLFSNAYDIAAIMQLLIDSGSYNGRQYINPSTIELFTSYRSHISRRGYGFDKPEKDNATRAKPYPCLSASPLTFGHTGFTGTCAWADPRYDLVFIFLSNRVNPNGGNNRELLDMDIRAKIQEAVYQAMRP